MTQRTLATLLALFALSACGSRTAVVTWPHTSWYSRRGTGESDVVFERDRQECLEETELQAVAQSVEPNGAEEAAFVRCMNEAGWCTHLLQCRGVVPRTPPPPTL